MGVKKKMLRKEPKLENEPEEIQQSGQLPIQVASSPARPKLAEEHRLRETDDLFCCYKTQHRFH